MAIYGFIASVLPVWLLLAPRDYLSTYVKLGTIAALVVGVFLVHPDIRFPAFTQFVHGGGPIIKGKLFPFLFVTIACGAISGFHSLVSSGTTPKMLDKETDARFIGYGAMMAESLVGVLALIAATSMYPGDYFAINSTAAEFGKLGLHTVNLDGFSREVGENPGRTHRRRCLAGHRNGADLPRTAGDGPLDGLLVSLRHHVRGAVHPDDHRCGHAGVALCHARVAGAGAQDALPTLRGCRAI